MRDIITTFFFKKSECDTIMNVCDRSTILNYLGQWIKRISRTNCNKPIGNSKWLSETDWSEAQKSSDQTVESRKKELN